MTAPQQVWRIGEERERGRERGECYSDDELLTMGGGGGRRAASRGAGAGLSMHTLAASFVQTETRLTASAYPRFGLLMSLLLFGLVYTDVDL